MIVVQVVPDRFTEAERKLLTGESSSSRQTKNHVRRPTRGIVLKEDTFATLRVVAGNGNSINIVDAGSRRLGDDNQPLVIGNKRATDIYSNFLLQQVQEERAEKQQIVETFGDPYIFLFGQRARVITFTGILANTWDFNWESEWWHNYENYLRGTRCVEMDARVFISFDTRLVGGYIISAAATKVSPDQNWVQFSFQLFVTSDTDFSSIGDPKADPGNGIFRSRELSEAQAAVFRPTLLTDVGAGNPPPGSIVTSAGLIPMSLADQQVQSLIDSVSQVWASASQIVDGVISTASQLLNGDLVRVPIGFAGTMAFDDDTNVKVRDVTFGGKIRFTTFEDNDDEYVGSSNHYGSSNLRPSFGDTSFSKELTAGQSVVEEAKKEWAKFGLAPPETQMGPLSSFIARQTIGMAGVGATSAWTQIAAPGGDLNPDGKLPLSILGDTGVRDASLPE